METLSVSSATSVRASFYRDWGWLESILLRGECYRLNRLLLWPTESDGCIPRLPGRGLISHFHHH